MKISFIVLDVQPGQTRYWLCWLSSGQPMQSDHEVLIVTTAHASNMVQQLNALTTRNLLDMFGTPTRSFTAARAEHGRTARGTTWCFLDGDQSQTKFCAPAHLAGRSRCFVNGVGFY
jgi:hypothetical protein